MAEKKAKTAEKSGADQQRKRLCPSCGAESRVVQYTGFGPRGFFWVCEKACGYRRYPLIDVPTARRFRHGADRKFAARSKSSRSRFDDEETRQDGEEDASVGEAAGEDQKQYEERSASESELKGRS